MKHSIKLCSILIITSSILFISTSLQAGAWPPEGNASKGAKAWVSNCGRCHNIRDGKELRDDQWVTTMFHMRVRAGLTGEDTRNILAFLQSSNTPRLKSTIKRHASSTKNTLSSGLSGADIYAQTCIACHGGNGKGVVPGAPDFTNKNGRLSKTDKTLLNSLQNGLQSPGSPMAMPAKGGNSALTQTDLKNVLEYLRETF